MSDSADGGREAEGTLRAEALDRGRAAPRRSAPLPRAWRYALFGAVLGLGAPLGYAVLCRLILPRRVRRRHGASQQLVYGYTALTTPLAFGLFGRALGRKEDRLSAARAHIEQQRDEFSAVVAHDLRTPVHAFLLHIQALLRQVKGEEVTISAVSLRKMERGGKRLAAMVDELLEATRIEAARIDLKPRTVSLPEAVTGLVDRIRPTLGAHDVEIDVSPVPPVRADPLRLDRILTNLLENAVKYSPEGAPIAIRLRPSANGATISIEDRGRGIEPHDLPRLFDRFYQSRRAREKRTGLGLGLYITKGLVEAHGGRIDVQSRPGVGSTFSVWLPGARRVEAPRSQNELTRPRARHGADRAPPRSSRGGRP